MKKAFVQTENVKQFLSAVSSVQNRAAPEACFALISGTAGMGKTHCGHWFAAQTNAIHIRIKSAVTPHWLLKDIMQQLNEAPARSCEQMFERAVMELIRNPRAMVFDEVEHAVANLRVLETIRDIGDTVEVPIVLIGREWISGKIKQQPQIATRVTSFAEFGQATLADVKLLCSTLAEVEIAPEVAELILEQSGGFIRNVITAIRNAESAVARNHGKPVTLESLSGRPLCAQWFKSVKKAAA